MKLKALALGIILGALTEGCVVRTYGPGFVPTYSSPAYFYSPSPAYYSPAYASPFVGRPYGWGGWGGGYGRGGWGGYYGRGWGGGWGGYGRGGWGWRR